jgi:hypothetical protein
VSAAQIATNAVTELKLLDGAVTAAKTAVAAISSTTGNLTANSVGTTQITDNAITSQKITANAIIAGKIAADAIVASNIQAGTITGDRILANTITGNNIAALTIGAQAIAAQAITAVKIESGAVTSDKIFAGAVTSDKITVNNLAAINANMGAITAGSLTIGSSPAISGTTMTGSGAKLNTDGTFALGNSSSNINFNGTAININNLANASANSILGATDITGPAWYPGYPLLTFTKKDATTGLLTSSGSYQFTSSFTGADSYILDLYLTLQGNNGWGLTTHHIRLQGVLGPTAAVTKQAGGSANFTSLFNTNEFGSGAIGATSIVMGLVYNAYIYNSAGTLISNNPAHWQLIMIASKNSFYQPLLGS